MLGLEELLGERDGLFEFGQGRRGILVVKAGAGGSPENTSQVWRAIGLKPLEHRDAVVEPLSGFDRLFQPLASAGQVAQTDGDFDMVGAERALLDLQRPHEQRLGSVVLALGEIVGADVVQGLGNAGVIRAEDLLVDRKSPLKQGFRLGASAELGVEHGEVVQVRGHQRVIRAEVLLADRRGPRIERLGPGVFAIFATDLRQVVESGCDRGVVRNQDFFIDRQRADEQRLRLVEQALDRFEVAHAPQYAGHVRMVRTEGVLMDGQSSEAQGLGPARRPCAGIAALATSGCLAGEELT